jgi:hypothetical protein
VRTPTCGWGLYKYPSDVERLESIFIGNYQLPSPSTRPVINQGSNLGKDGLLNEENFDICFNIFFYLFYIYLIHPYSRDVGKVTIKTFTQRLRSLR